MDCLQNRIGILGCDAPATEGTPAEGYSPAVAALPILLVNDLPGVSFENFSSLVSGDQETFLELWTKIVLRTMKKFEVLVKRELNKCHRITDNTVISCLVCEKKELFDVALWYLHGVEVMIERTSTDAMNRYTSIDLDKAERLKEEFYAEFQSALSDAVLSMNPEDSDCIDGCVDCNDAIRFVQQTP